MILCFKNPVLSQSSIFSSQSPVTSSQSLVLIFCYIFLFTYFFVIFLDLHIFVTKLELCTFEDILWSPAEHKQQLDCLGGRSLTAQGEEAVMLGALRGLEVQRP